MSTALLVLQILLALVFLFSGVMKLSQPKEKIAEKMAWAEDFSPGQIKLIGLLELLGAIGLVLPLVFGILPALVPLAAVGLALTMAGAAFTHLRRKEGSMAIPSIVLLVLLLFVAYNQFTSLTI